MIDELLVGQYNIYDLGFNKLLSRVSTNFGAIGQEINALPLSSIMGNGFIEIAASQLADGELDQNLTMIAGRLQSANFVTGVSGWRILYNGDVEFNTGTFRGSLIAGSIHIPDQDSTANSFHANSSGTTWWGCTETLFTANNDNATAYILNTGIAKFANITIAGGAVSGITLDIGGADATSFHCDINGNIWSGAATYNIATNPFAVSNAGALVATSATITGAITATSGTIGSFTIGTYLYTGSKTAYNDANAGIHLGSDGIGIANNLFTVSAAGVLTAVSGTIGGWTLGATTLTATTLILDAGNQKIESSNYVSGIAGAGFHIDSNLLEVGNIACRGLIRTAVFQKDVISVVGGNVAVLDGDVLDADMTAADNSTLTIKGNTTFSVGDILRIKDGTDDEWLEVTNIGSAPTYTVTRDKDAQYAANTNPTWKKGATVVNYQQSGDGGIYMTASESNAPYLSIFTHAGSPYDTITTSVRLGNLNGFLGYSSDLYGIAIGEATKYLKYDATNGLQIQGKVTITSGSSGIANLSDAGALALLSVIGNAYITDLNVDKLSAGTITSKAIVLAIAAGTGDVYIAAGKSDFTNTDNGFILGMDDSDSDKVKFYLGDATTYLNWTGAALSIKGSVTITGGSGIANLSDAGDLSVLDVIGNAYITDLAVDKLSAGTISSKAIVLAIAAGTGDSYIAAGKSDFTNTDAGFILGLDDSDSDKPKFYLGDANTYLNWTGAALSVKGSITITGGSGIASLSDAGALAVLSVIGDAYITDLAVSKLTAGSITSQAITLVVAAGTGDSKIQAGKTDFDNTVAGFILGIDDSDSDKAKFYIGDSTYYLNWTGTALNLKVAASNLMMYECVVDAGGDGDYTTLGAAVTAGKTSIFVRAGAYTETGNITLSANTSITGEDWDTTEITLAGYQVIFNNNKIAIKNITFYGSKSNDFQITGSGDDCYFEKVRIDCPNKAAWTNGLNSSGLRFRMMSCEVLVSNDVATISGNNALIDRCKFYGGRVDTSSGNLNANEINLSGDGIVFSHNDFIRTNSGNYNNGGVYVTGDRCTISNNLITEDAGYTTGVNVSGIEATINNNFIEGWNDGINLNGISKQVCVGNTLNNIGDDGIIVSGANNAGYGYKNIIGNVIYNPGGDGIVPGIRSVISGNSVYSAGGHGINGGSTNIFYLIITSNNCSECAGSGIYVCGNTAYQGSNMVIGNNFCFDNAGYGIYADLSEASVVGNVLYANDSGESAIVDNGGCEVAHNIL